MYEIKILKYKYNLKNYMHLSLNNFIFFLEKKTLYSVNISIYKQFLLLIYAIDKLIKI